MYRNAMDKLLKWKDKKNKKPLIIADSDNFSLIKTLS